MAYVFDWVDDTQICPDSSSQVSTTAPEIIAFVEGLSAEDPLVKGVPEDKNPFKEKGGCIIT